MTVPWSPIPCESTENGAQLVGLIVKFGLSMLTWIERIRIGMPPMIEGTVSETALTWAVERVDVERDPDDDGAVVVGAGQGRGDRDQADSGAPLNGPGQVHLADRVERVAAGAGGDVGGADLARGRAARAAPARRGRGSAAAAAIDGLRAVGDPAQVAGEAGRHLEVEVAEELVAVVAVELQGEGAEGAGGRVRGAGHEARVEGPDLARAAASVRAASRG